jgi:hypothetical protein
MKPSPPCKTWSLERLKRELARSTQYASDPGSSPGTREYYEADAALLRERIAEVERALGPKGMAI